MLVEGRLSELNSDFSHNIMMFNHLKKEVIMKRIELYKIINDELVLVDYGVESQIDSYTAQGYIVSIAFYLTVV